MADVDIRFTVITVVRNDEKGIENTIMSVVQQKYCNYEYIVIDGLSTDDTTKIINKYRDQIATYISEQDNGIYDAMNKAVAYSNGKWVIFLNSGDSFSDTHVLQAVSESIDSQNADLMYGDYFYLKNGRKKVLVKAKKLTKMWKRISFSHQALFVKKELLKSKPFDLTYDIVADYNFYYQCHVDGKRFYYMNIPIANVSAGGVSDLNFLRRTNQRLKVVLRYGAPVNRVKVILFYLRNFYIPHFFKPIVSLHTKLSETIKVGTFNLLSNMKYIDANSEMISVVVPNYNNSPFVIECLLSILNQSYENIEVILIDDASTDDSLSKVLKIKDTRLKVIANKKNQGISRVRNIGISESRGKYITTLDSDDMFISKDKIKMEYNCIKKHAKQNRNVAAFSKVTLLSRKGSLLKRNNVSNVEIKEGWLYEAILNRSAFVPRDFMVDKSVYNIVGLYDDSLPLYEDWDMKLRLAKHVQFRFAGVNGVGYRMHNEGLSACPDAYKKKWHDHVYEMHATKDLVS